MASSGSLYSGLGACVTTFDPEWPDSGEVGRRVFELEVFAFSW